MPPITDERPRNRGESADDLLVDGALTLGLCLSPEALAAFRVYREELIRWSGRMNLTAFGNPTQIVREGFLDSLSCVPLLPAGARRILDLGAGAGFPAVPIALARPELEFTLVEASRKKVTFLRHIARRLRLTSLRIVAGRSEALSESSVLGVFDAALARAVAPLVDAGRLVFPFLRSGGVFVAQVGPDGPTDDVLARLSAIGFEKAGEAAVPAAVGKPGRRILALRKASA